MGSRAEDIMLGAQVEEYRLGRKSLKERDGEEAVGRPLALFNCTPLKGDLTWLGRKEGGDEVCLSLMGTGRPS
ncbi:hypothetical protein ACLOJK_007735 [Asimina triloba]